LPQDIDTTCEKGVSPIQAAVADPAVAVDPAVADLVAHWLA
jgi:hypothetical protein